PEQRLVPHDRSVGAGDAALRPRRVPATEAWQIGGIPGAVWPAAGRDCAPPGCPPLSAADCRVCPPNPVARPAEAEDPTSPTHDPVAYRCAAAGALCHGRPALGRSDHVRIPQSPGRSRPHVPHPGAVHLSSRLQPALDGTFAPHPDDPAALAAATGG